MHSGGAKYNGTLWQRRNMDVRFEWNAVPVFVTKCSKDDEEDEERRAEEEAPH